MRFRVFRLIAGPSAGIVSILLLAGTPMHAAPVTISDVIQIIGSYHPSQEMIRSSSETGPSVTGDSAKSILAGSQEPQGGVDIIHPGDVEVTICDCGESLIAGGISGGGLPKWPLLFLTAIPLIFTQGDGTPDTLFTPPTPQFPSITSTPSPSPQTAIPEPTSLLLLGSGLVAFGAALRRRYVGTKLAARVDATDEG